MRLDRNPVTDSAAVLARACGGRFALPQQTAYGALRLFQAPEGSLPASEGPIAAWGARWGAVYVGQSYVGEVRVWAHEFLHQFYHLPGSHRVPHPPIFQDCRLVL